MSSVYLESPYLSDDGAVWMRGNLHVHTIRSDGAAAPREVVAHYASLGYDFLALSDHDVLADLEGLDPCGMVLLPANEVCGGGPHVLDVGARELIQAMENQQEVLDAIARRSGLAVLCHPNWGEEFNHYPYEDLRALTNYIGVEIFNGLVTDQPGYHLATDKWDRLLASGRKVWGFANDDAHRFTQTGRGWNVARVRERSAAALLEAFRTGSFYASSGVEIESIACEGPVLHLKAPKASRINIFGHLGARVHWVDAGEVHFDASAVAAPSIRVECYGCGGAAAWTQPFAIRNGTFERLQEKLARAGSLDKGVLRVHRAARAPKLTGKLTDPLWRKAEPFERFVSFKDGEPAPVRTEVRCILAGRTLYLGARCEEPLPESMKLTADRDGQPNLWANDSLEFFLDAEGRAAGCLHVMVNADGYSVAVPRCRQSLQTPALRAKAGRWSQGGTHGWSVELAIPLSPDADTGKGRRWGFHICRNRYPAAGTYVWSWVGASNHNVEQYGSLVF